MVHPQHRITSTIRPTTTAEKIVAKKVCPMALAMSLSSVVTSILMSSSEHLLKASPRAIVYSALSANREMYLEQRTRMAMLRPRL